MMAATRPVQRPRDAKLLVVEPSGQVRHALRAQLVDFLKRGDLVVANDASTLPASLRGVHVPTGHDIEVRLAGRRSLSGEDVREFVAVVFGGGDYRARTEDRPMPLPLAAGDRLQLGPLRATIASVLDHPRLVRLELDGTAESIWAGLAHHGRPIQYAHVPDPLALWDVWSPISSVPAAFEPPSATFAIDWHTVRQLRDRRIAFATLTHAAGISSTGDPELDRQLPFDEPYRIPESTAAAIRRARARGGRVMAIGTTVVRALESAADGTGSGIVLAGTGLATGRIGQFTRRRVVDAVLTGTHEPETSHYQLLKAFATDATLRHASVELEARGYRTHEFGDSMLIMGVAIAEPRPRHRHPGTVLDATQNVYTVQSSGAGGLADGTS